MSEAKDPRPRVIFLCYGNACRSQMAEGYARLLGADVLRPASAGLHPIGFIPEEVAVVMKEEGVDLSDHWSKPLESVYGDGIDLVVDLVGGPLPHLGGIPIRHRAVADPFRRSLRTYRRTRDAVRLEVEALVEECRRGLVP